MSRGWRNLNIMPRKLNFILESNKETLIDDS